MGERRGGFILGRQPGGEAEFAVGELGAEALGQFAFLTGPAAEGQEAQRLRCGEIRGSAQLLRGVAEEPSLQCNGNFGQTGDFEGQPVAGCAPAAADRAAGQDHFWCRAQQFGLPPGFLVAGQVGHLGQVLAKTGVPGFEQGQKLVANAVAGEGEVAVGGVFAPFLAESVQISLDLNAAGCKQGTKNAAFCELHGGMNA